MVFLTFVCLRRGTLVQVIPGVSSVPVYSTLVPLLVVLGVTAVKDAFDDIVSG